jgi:outer membrane receptor protein involved in Fe transport
VSLAYAAGAATNFRASIARGYRAPSAIEQFVSTRQYGFQVVPNPELRGEHAWSGEVGVTTYPWSALRIDGAVFGSRYEDLIAPAAAPDQILVFQFQNVSRARVLGLDVGARATVVPGVIDLGANYLFLNSEDLETGKALPYRSQHNVTGTVTALRGLAAVDVRYRSRVEEVIGYPLDPRGSIFTLDVRGLIRPSVSLSLPASATCSTRSTRTCRSAPRVRRGNGASASTRSSDLTGRSQK